MMSERDYLLTCLAEECAEISEQCSKVAVRVSKLLRFSPEEIQPGQLLTNLERLQVELADVLAVAEVLESEGFISRAQIDQKKLKIKEFMAYSRKCGRLMEP